MGGASQGQPTRGVIHGQDSTTAGRGRRHGRARPLGRGRRVRVRRERERRGRGERQRDGERDHRRRLPGLEHEHDRVVGHGRDEHAGGGEHERPPAPAPPAPSGDAVGVAEHVGVDGRLGVVELLDVLDVVVAPMRGGAPVRRAPPAPVLAAVAARWPRWRHARSPVTCAARAEPTQRGEGQPHAFVGVRRILSAIRTLFVEPCGAGARLGRPGRSLLPPHRVGSPAPARAREWPDEAPGRRRRRVDVARGRR